MAIACSRERLLLQDFQRIASKLRCIYRGSRGSRQATLTGEFLEKPYPILRYGGAEFRGVPVSFHGFKGFEVVPHQKRLLAVDASLKMLFDCGSFKVALAKVACILWEGRRRLEVWNPVKRAQLVWSRVEAAEFLFEVEVEAALQALPLLGEGDYCILDRPLMPPPKSREAAKKLLRRLEAEVTARGAVLVGISKSSQLKLNTGEPLLGYLIYLSRALDVRAPWFYYPVFRCTPPFTWMITGVACFSEEADHVFRVDFTASCDESRLPEYLGEIAYLQDPACPGYPYPPRSVHEDAKTSKQELLADRLAFLELLSQEGLEKRFLSSAKTASFREEVLWRR